MKYLCECCGYSTDRKSNYSKHILTDKHLVRSSMYPNVSKCIQNVSKCIQNVSISDVSKCIQKNKNIQNVSKCIQKNNYDNLDENNNNLKEINEKPEKCLSVNIAVSPINIAKDLANISNIRVRTIKTRI